MAFAADPLARDLAIKALDQGWTHAAPIAWHQFLLMPLMHSENLADQERCVAEFLPVKDGLELGLAASAGSTDSQRLVEGLDATLRLFGAALERLGVEELDPLGKPFDPDQHEAMVVQPSAEHPENTVLAVVQRGYRVAGRVIRPARVVVSRRAAGSVPHPAGTAPADPAPEQDGLF